MTIIVKDAARLLHGKSALLNPVTGMDNALMQGQWIHPSKLELRQPVEAIRHLGGRHQSAVGQVVQVEDLHTGNQGYIQYLEMYKVMSDALSAEELAAIGYQSAEDFEAVEQVGSRPMWLIHVQHMPNGDAKKLN
jgi:hypothetical protein